MSAALAGKKPELELHPATLAATGKKGLLFFSSAARTANQCSERARTARGTGTQGGRIEEDLMPHDLRHTGNTLMAMTGASTKELMARLGQSSPRAALIYQRPQGSRPRARRRAQLSGLIETKLQQHRPTGTEDGRTT